MTVYPVVGSYGLGSATVESKAVDRCGERRGFTIIDEGERDGMRKHTRSTPTDQSLHSQTMIDTIKEGVPHGKMGGDGMEGEGPGKPYERRLQRVDSLRPSFEQCCCPFFNRLLGAEPF